MEFPLLSRLSVVYFSVHVLRFGSPQRFFRFLGFPAFKADLTNPAILARFLFRE